MEWHRCPQKLFVLCKGLQPNRDDIQRLRLAEGAALRIQCKLRLAVTALSTFPYFLGLCYGFLQIWSHLPRGDAHPDYELVPNYEVLIGKRFDKRPTRIHAPSCTWVDPYVPIHCEWNGVDSFKIKRSNCFYFQDFLASNKSLKIGPILSFLATGDYKIQINITAIDSGSFIGDIEIYANLVTAHKDTFG